MSRRIEKGSKSFEKSVRKSKIESKHSALSIVKILIRERMMHKHVVKRPRGAKANYFVMMHKEN